MPKIFCLASTAGWPRAGRSVHSAGYSDNSPNGRTSTSGETTPSRMSASFSSVVTSTPATRMTCIPAQELVPKKPKTMAFLAHQATGASSIAASTAQAAPLRRSSRDTAIGSSAIATSQAGWKVDRRRQRSVGHRSATANRPGVGRSSS